MMVIIMIKIIIFIWCSTGAACLHLITLWHEKAEDGSDTDSRINIGFSRKERPFTNQPIEEEMSFPYFDGHKPHWGGEEILFDMPMASHGDCNSRWKLILYQSVKVILGFKETQDVIFQYFCLKSKFILGRRNILKSFGQQSTSHKLCH